MKDKWLWMIVILGLVFRLINFKQSFSFAHDQDLYSWIAKDIIVNHHQRLVGQLTSVDGVFIGSFYYYLMAFFYAIFGMNPLSAAIPLTLLGVASIISTYYIFKINFNVRTARIGAFVYAVSFGVASFDRWSVPTQPTLIWSIWFLAVILGLYKGKLKYLLVYAFLVGFVWQLHIALIPILPIPIVAYFIGGNKFYKLWNGNNLKTTLISIIIFAITISPFIVFELKHNFLQIKSMAAGINVNTGAVTGTAKLLKVIDASGKEFQTRFLFGQTNDYNFVYWIFLVIITSFLLFKIDKKITFLLYLWILMILWAQLASKRLVSEYYFTNLVPVLLLFVSLFVDLYLKKIIFLAAAGYISINFWWLINYSHDQSYLFKEQVMNYIRSDVKKNNYPCIAVNFIADPGVGVGFRYLFWYYNIKLVKPGTANVPIYNIPIPWQISMHENPVHFGRFGVLLPKPIKEIVSDEVCNDPKNQLDPLLGYTE